MGKTGGFVEKQLEKYERLLAVYEKQQEKYEATLQQWKDRPIDKPESS